MLLDPDEITIGSRFRVNVDEGIRELSQSIQKLGQLQPVIIDATRGLICGARRIRACELLGIQVWAEEVVGLDEIMARLEAERDENTCRVPFTPSEAVALKQRLEEFEEPKARERQGKRTDLELPAKFAESSPGEVREKVAEAVGLSHETLRKAEVVVEAAAADDAPAVVVEAAAEMDRTGKVDPAYKAVTAWQLAKPAPLVITQQESDNWAALRDTTFRRINQFVALHPATRDLILGDLRDLLREVKGPAP